MKLSKVFTLVLASHFGVIAVLLIQPGCQTKKASSQQPQKSNIVSKTVRPVPIANAGDAQNRTRLLRNYSVDTVAPEGTTESYNVQSGDRYPPSRPAQDYSSQGFPVQDSNEWNLIEENEAEIIAGSDSMNTTYEPLEPIVDINPALNPELEPITTRTYTVVKGDNLTKIANQHGISLADLMSANGLNKKSVLSIGQVLVIPDEFGNTGMIAVEAPSPQFTNTSAEVDSTIYIVVPGDNLIKISRKFGTSVSTIKSSNGLSSNTIYAGQELIVPTGSGGVRYSSSNSTVVAPIATSARTGEVSYKVQSGDTFGVLSKRFGISVAELMKRNGISDPRRLRAGQTIIVPAGGSVPAKNYSTSSQPVQYQSRPSVAPIPAPVPAIQSQPAPVQAAPVQNVDNGTLDEINLDDVPVVPVESSE